MSQRFIQLYKEGGVSEVYRGVRDWYRYNVYQPIAAQVYNTATLNAANASVKWTIENEESVSRAAGFSEMPVMEDFVSSIKQDEVFWDVGANQGAYSMLAANSGLCVHSFEPGEIARSILQKNADINGFEVNIHPIALDDESGVKTLSKTGRTGDRTIIESGSGDNVPVERGDEVSAPAPDVIKIDVEGLELRVLDGLHNHLASCRLCYVEVHDESDVNNVEELLMKRGLTEITHLPDPHTIVRAQRDD